MKEYSNRPRALQRLLRATTLARMALRVAVGYQTIGGVAEDRKEAYNAGRGSDRLTIAEAATLLGVHKNTIRNRVKDGTYKAEKVITERGPTYLIERQSLLTNLTTNTLSSTSQELVSPQAMEFVQELLRPFVSELGEVREQLGAERARRQMAEERVSALEGELEALRAPETATEPVPNTETPEDQQEPVQRRSWWREFFGIGG